MTLLHQYLLAAMDVQTLRRMSHAAAVKHIDGVSLIVNFQFSIVN